MAEPETGEEEKVIIAAHTLSDVGNSRDENQDSIRVSDADERVHKFGWLYGIADGMGGYSHGGVASALALETFFDSFYGSDPRNLQQVMKRSAQDANLAVYQKALNLKVGRMGTTLTAVNILGNRLTLAHVGDSRAYLIREGQAKCLTNDHTAVGELVRMKVIGAEKVRHHAQRSILNRCLGVEMIIQPDVSQVALMNGDVLVLCSDGLWSAIEDHEFAAFLGKSSSPEGLSRLLIDTALERETDDNLSVVVIHAEKLPEAEAVEPTRRWGLPQLFRSRFSEKS